jgi:hypothetical protein
VEPVFKNKKEKNNNFKDLAATPLSLSFQTNKQSLSFLSVFARLDHRVSILPPCFPRHGSTPATRMKWAFLDTVSLCTKQRLSSAAKPRATPAQR